MEFIDYKKVVAAWLILGCFVASAGDQSASTLRNTIWRDPTINVCWENPADANQQARALVQRSIAETWEANSLVQFVGWTRCTNVSRGIRIRIEDSPDGAYVSTLGRRLDGMRNGMVLNFSFRKWNTDCRPPSKRDYCIRLIAVHEFGHALSFTHEHNKTDTPAWCTESPQGTTGDIYIGEWDESSVMNYCNPKYVNDGKLSDTDVIALQMFYGVPSSKPLISVTDITGICDFSDVTSVPVCHHQCSRNIFSACETLGLMYAEGRGVAQSSEHAARLLKPACEAKRPRACEYLGQLELESGANPDEDMVAARGYFERACEAGGGGGCAELARFAEKGLAGMAVDEVLAAKYLEKACASDTAIGCATLGAYFRSGRGGLPQDDQRAQALLQKACALGSTRGCLLAQEPAPKLEQPSKVVDEGKIR